ncbi:hypothetical protein [Shewanella aestuarii]|uniref:Uncharacterized protein n=1 Tax=Shewanella aestuarii TaxID=1028752 RepID=A0ABT0L3K7_9GAMM|nr:hypothetical protein [Shewanella aestuarii]MCL1118296.1 hypothetical protein [Shewanella aestuarii]
MFLRKIPVYYFRALATKEVIVHWVNSGQIILLFIKHANKSHPISPVYSAVTMSEFRSAWGYQATPSLTLHSALRRRLDD